MREGGRKAQHPENIISTGRYLETIAVLGVGKEQFIQYSFLPRDGWDQAEQPGLQGRLEGERQTHTVPAEELAHCFP